MDPRYQRPGPEFGTPRVPELHLGLPFIMDQLKTETSQKQSHTAESVMKLIGQTPLPGLERAAHARFLSDPLEYGLPSSFTGLDASRPWLLYWCINALALLGEDVGVYRERAVSSIRPLQYRSGGFGGGNGQRPHIASAYAAVLALAATSYHASRHLPEPQKLAIYADTFGWIDRNSLLGWIRKIKLPNGGFKVNEEGEEDVRAGYCVLVVLALMGYDEGELGGVPDSGEQHLLDGVVEYFKRCQTWEGGLGAKAHSEAHGGYAFCVLGALCLLGEPDTILNGVLDMGRLIDWLSARQYAPEGGLSGRTNKLVDGCYSTWVGGCWSLVEAAVNQAESRKQGSPISVGGIWNRRALVRYILTCCQGQHGGMRDKPGLRPDYYHTNYVLIGLSAAQNYYYFDLTRLTDPSLSRSPFKTGFCWKGSRNIPKPSTKEGYGGGWEADIMLDEHDRLEMQHPIFNIPLGSESELHAWWEYLKDPEADDWKSK